MDQSMSLETLDANAQRVSPTMYDRRSIEWLVKSSYLAETDFPRNTDRGSPWLILAAVTISELGFARKANVFIDRDRN
jgi:hypothetical protein